MATRTFPCPDCGSTLTTAREAPAGKKTRCPRCNLVFPIPEAGPDGGPPASPRLVSAPLAAADEPRPPGRKGLLIAGLVGGLLALLLGGGAVAAWVWPGFL